MSNVFFDVGISLDGYMAGPNGGPKNPLGKGGMAIHEWMFRQKSFREYLGMDGGEENYPDNDIIKETFNRIGSNIMGKRMFEEGEANWPEEAPFHTTVYVLTHQSRDPWKRKGGTTFYFTDEPIGVVLQKARMDAGNKDVRISGGASVIQQFLNAGLIDEFSIHIAPLILGKGVKLFENIEKQKFIVEINNVMHSPVVSHIIYKVVHKK